MLQGPRYILSVYQKEPSSQQCNPLYYNRASLVVQVDKAEDKEPGHLQTTGEFVISMHTCKYYMFTKQ